MVMALETGGLPRKLMRRLARIIHYITPRSTSL